MTGSDDQQFVITLVTVVNTSSIPFLERDRTPSVTSDEKNIKKTDKRQPYPKDCMSFSFL